MKGENLMLDLVNMMCGKQRKELGGRGRGGWFLKLCEKKKTEKEHGGEKKGIICPKHQGY